MRVYFEKREVLGVIAVLAVLAGLGILSFINIQRFPHAGLTAVYAVNVLYCSARRPPAIVDAEPCQRAVAPPDNQLCQESFRTQPPS